MRRLAGMIAMFAASGLMACETVAQSVGTVPRFEVASIRPCDPRSESGAVTGSPGRLDAGCMPVKRLIDFVYSSFANGQHFDARWSVPIEGAPAWLDADSYRVNAKAEGRPGVLTMLTGPMMRALLEDRFKLKLHRETRQVPVYALTVAKGPPHLEPFQEGTCIDREDPWDHPAPPKRPGLPACRVFRPANNGLDMFGTTMKEFCAFFRLDRPIIDRTGIRGTFNIHLALSYGDLGIPSDAVPGLPQGHPALTEPADIFDAVRTALEKAGLKLEATKGPQEVIVIDHVERPSPN